ncbi:RCC1-like G exchanging factor-like protein isoform X2 [Thrips palmi]|uniref:RCC1-like G exchanging factor-like protein isoform X2 n=1 Tax=Thrips palmi TaxID=161013 RepID=A0A6P9A498_THRPL|nr:RCC1-like G exchanging factor-like protein isoform X2 [Thrips palmi]
MRNLYNLTYNYTSVSVLNNGKPSKSGRRVYAWGVAETGALGIHTHRLKREMKTLAQFYHHPKRLHFSHLYKVNDIACGYGFTVYSVDPDLEKGQHKVFGSGLNTDSQIGYHAVRAGHPLALLLNPAPINIPLKSIKTRVKGLAAGRAHLLVHTDDGVFSLGNNAYGQCGRPIIENENYSGSRIVHKIVNLPADEIRSVACGQDHSMFITEKGSVYACGWNADGQTGQNNYESNWEPKLVTGDVVGEDIVKLSCAGDCVLALNRKGEVFGWGNSEYGQLCKDSLQLATSKHLLFTRDLGKIIDVAAGGSFCMALNEHGQVFVWGFGILGKGPKAQKSMTPTEIPPILFGRNEFQPDSKVNQVACGLHHFMAVTNKGDLYSWGHNRGGCLGLGHDKDQFFPMKVAVGASVAKVSCGVDHTVVVCSSF